MTLPGGGGKVARLLGMEDAPGYRSVIASVLVGAATGFVATGWQGAVLGALAGFAATGAHQLPKQIAKRQRDLYDLQEKLDFDS